MKMKTRLLLIFLLLTGCATGGRELHTPTIEAPKASDRPAVSRFADGRTGFVLNEIAELNAEQQRDFDLAVAALQSGDYGQAIELLEPLVETSPGVTAPYINLAIAYRKLGVPEEGEDYLQAALQLFPDHPVASNEYGLLLRQAGRFAEARSRYEQALERFPEYLPARRNLAILCDLYLFDSECALRHYQQYRELDPENQQIELWLAELQMRQGQ